MAAVKVLHWEFEGSLVDSTASENAGVFIGDGNPHFIEGRFGQAIQLDSGQSVASRSATNIPTAQGDSWTINLWAKVTAPPPDGAIFGGMGGRAEIPCDKRFVICFNESVYFWEGDAGGGSRRDLDSEVRFPVDGEWHMYTATFDSGAQRLTLSVDAIEIAVVQPVTTLVDALPVASVGGAPDFFGESFEGAIDEFAIWVGALSPPQIRLLYSKNTAILPPPLWQRLWFVSLVSIVLGSGVTVGLRLKERRKQQRLIVGLERASALDRERARIAKDIHDDLGASLTHMSLLGEMTVGELGSVDETKNVGEARALSEEISSTARELVGRLDEIVWAVDPKNDSLDSLSSYLVRSAQEFLEAAQIRFRLDVPSTFPEHNVAPDVRHHFLMAFKEGLNNLVKHAAASECVIRMAVAGNWLDLSIEDNGEGVDESLLGSGEGGHGLQNMRDRMDTVKGRFTIEKRKPNGTRLQFELPLA